MKYNLYEENFEKSILKKNKLCSRLTLLCLSVSKYFDPVQVLVLALPPFPPVGEIAVFLNSDALEKIVGTPAVRRIVMLSILVYGAPSCCLQAVLLLNLWAPDCGSLDTRWFSYGCFWHLLDALAAFSVAARCRSDCCF